MCACVFLFLSALCLILSVYVSVIVGTTGIIQQYSLSSTGDGFSPNSWTLQCCMNEPCNHWEFLDYQNNQSTVFLGNLNPVIYVLANQLSCVGYRFQFLSNSGTFPYAQLNIKSIILASSYPLVQQRLHIVRSTAGGIATASSGSTAGFPPSCSFTPYCTPLAGVGTMGFQTSSGVYTGNYLQYTFPAGLSWPITQYTIQGWMSTVAVGAGSIDYTPQVFSLQGLNPDGVTWTTIDFRQGQIWLHNEVKFYQVTGNTSQTWSTVRLNFLDSGVGFYALGKITFRSPPQDITALRLDATLLPIGSWQIPFIPSWSPSQFAFTAYIPYSAVSVRITATFSTVGSLSYQWNSTAPVALATTVASSQVNVAPSTTSSLTLISTVDGSYYFTIIKYTVDEMTISLYGTPYYGTGTRQLLLNPPWVSGGFYFSSTIPYLMTGIQALVTYQTPTNVVSFDSNALSFATIAASGIMSTPPVAMLSGSTQTFHVNSIYSGNVSFALTSQPDLLSPFFLLSVQVYPTYTTSAMSFSPSFTPSNRDYFCSNVSYDTLNITVRVFFLTPMSFLSPPMYPYNHPR